MFEEARIPLIDPDFYEPEEAKNKKNKEESKERVVILDISPKCDSTIDL
jgi:hypothetical protein